MYENSVIKEIPAEDTITQNNGYNIKKKFIKILSENKFSISQTRCLFNSILEQFERYMPVTNHKNRQN